MKVYVLLRTDSYDRNEVLGVYAAEDAAKRAAEAAEPDRRFTWETLDGGPYASDYAVDGPIYSYSAERFDVAE